VWLDSIDDWKAIVADTDFVKEVAGELQDPDRTPYIYIYIYLFSNGFFLPLPADELNFLQHPIHIMIGYDNLIIGEEWKAKGAGN
jgi:hypothetical protein